MSQEGGAIISMDGVYFAMSQEGGAIISMDGRTENCSLHFLHFHHPWWSYFAMSQEGGAIISTGGGHAEFVRNDFSALLTANCLLITLLY